MSEGCSKEGIHTLPMLQPHALLSKLRTLFNISYFEMTGTNPSHNLTSDDSHSSTDVQTHASAPDPPATYEFLVLADLLVSEKGLRFPKNIGNWKCHKVCKDGVDTAPSRLPTVMLLNVYWNRNH